MRTLARTFAFCVVRRFSRSEYYSHPVDKKRGKVFLCYYDGISMTPGIRILEVITAVQASFYSLGLKTNAKTAHVPSLFGLLFHVHLHLLCRLVARCVLYQTQSTQNKYEIVAYRSKKEKEKNKAWRNRLTTFSVPCILVVFWNVSLLVFNYICWSLERYKMRLPQNDFGELINALTS